MKNRLYRSKTNCIIGGVCGGIAETYHIDPSLVRLGTVFLCLVTGVLPIVLIYLVAWGIFPVKNF